MNVDPEFNEVHLGVMFDERLHAAQTEHQVGSRHLRGLLTPVRRPERIDDNFYRNYIFRNNFLYVGVLMYNVHIV